MNWEAVEEYLEELRSLIQTATPDNLGDVIQAAFSKIASGPPNPEQLSGEQLGAVHAVVEHYTITLNSMASRADLGWKLFKNIEKPNRPLSDEQALQIVSVSLALREVALCLASLIEAAKITTWGSTAIRFYINSLCSNVSAWFLLDAKDNRKLGFSKPGSIIRVLQPIGLEHLLDPIYVVLEKPLGLISFREAVLQIRNQAIVHTDFLPDGIKRLYTHSELHKLENKLQLNIMWNELGNEILILQLKLLAIFRDTEKDLEQTIRTYMGDLLGPDFDFTTDWGPFA